MRVLEKSQWEAGLSFMETLSAVIVLLILWMVFKTVKEKQGDADVEAEGKPIPAMPAPDPTVPEWDGSDESKLPNPIERKVRGIKSQIEGQGKNLQIE